MLAWKARLSLDDPLDNRQPSSRMQIENRNTAEAKSNCVWKMIADKWNDPDFAPSTEASNELHPEYEGSETIVNSFL